MSAERFSMPTILARMELMPGVGAAGQGSGKTPHQTSREPTGTRWSLADEWRERYVKAEPYRREAVRTEAQSALESFRRRDVEACVMVEETLAQREARVVLEGRGWGVRETAVHCRVTETFVRKARLNAARQASRSAVEHIDEHLDRVGRMRVMRSEGRSLRQIAMLLGTNAMAVRRDLEKAA